MLDERFINLIAQEVKAENSAVRAAVELLHHGARVPFIARYRRDATGDLRESRLRIVQQRMVEYNAIAQRQRALIDSLESKGWLTEELRSEIDDCVDTEALDDLYLSFRKHKGSSADRAREQGLSTLAELIWIQDPGESDIPARAAEYVDSNQGIDTPEAAVAGAIEILKERISHDRMARRAIREKLLHDGELVAHATAAAEGKRTKFESYYAYREKLLSVPSHRLLALSRGTRRGILRTELSIDENAMRELLRSRYLKEADSPFAEYIDRAIDEAFAESLRPQCEEQAMTRVRRKAEDHAIQVFCDNAHSLYLQPPAGAISVLALEAGIDDVCALTVVDGDGKCIAWNTLEGAPNDVQTAAVAQASELMQEHDVKALAISANGPSRQIALQIREKAMPAENPPYVVSVNGSGLSVYAGSEAAETEFKELPRAARASVAIARRHQDPLRELSKIDPRAVGAGQYYQEINQKRLTEALALVLESCVDAVGADVNRADAGWLSHISGLRAESAANIVGHRSEHGNIDCLEKLSEIRGVGPKVYEQCVGFLFLADGSQPLDNTRIHPEQYALVEQAISDAGLDVTKTIGHQDTVRQIDWSQYEAAAGGPKAIGAIQHELSRPGEDPRKPFKPSRVHGRLRPVSELTVGEEIEGIVTNITDFGAFVDVGTRQDGLVHLSEMSNQFVSDPHRVVRLGQLVVVKVTAVDADAPRISLSMKAAHKPKRGKSRERDARPAKSSQAQKHRRGNAEKSQTSGRRSSRGSGKKAPGGQRESKEPMNTQLADQLSALKDRFGSDD